MQEDGHGIQWNIEGEVQLLRSALRHLENSGFRGADVGVVLGSGLRGVAEGLEDARVLPCAELHCIPKPRVPGHGGELIQGRIGDTRVHCLSGRVHLYEGYHAWEVVRAVRLLALLGTPTILLTNAAGGIREDLVPGSLMAILDHVNLTGVNPLSGPNHRLFGARFPSMTGIWNAEARRILKEADPGSGLAEGVYVQVSGPSYETPAEVRMLRSLGGDAVGMSTVPEALALAAMGVRVVGLSVITNRAAGLSPTAPSHEEVISEGDRAADRVRGLLERALPALGALGPLEPKKGSRKRRRH